MVCGAEGRSHIPRVLGIFLQILGRARDLSPAKVREASLGEGDDEHDYLMAVEYSPVVFLLVFL